MCTNVKQLLSRGTLLALLCFSGSLAVAQENGRKKEHTGKSRLERKDSVPDKPAPVQPITASKPGALKPYKEVISPGAVSYKGFLTVHKVSDKYFLEIPDAVLGREILVVNRIGMAPADFRTPGRSLGYAGDIIGQQVFHFTKGEGNKLFLRMKSYSERSGDSSGNGLARALDRNNMEAILSSVAIKAVSDSLKCSVIEITDMMAQDNILFGFSPAAKTTAGLSALLSDRSYTEGVKNIGDRITFSFMRTYSKASGLSPAPFTFQLRTGMILLPELPMKPRFADKRIAFQDISYTDFDSNPLGVDRKSIICRWRLEPSNLKNYRAGKAVAPLKPIRIYLDPHLPYKWRPYVKSGVEAWNAAFSAAGFTNAIEVVLPGKKDTASFLDDVGRSAIVFMPGAGESNSQVITDPRSGEILQVQLNFYLGTLDKLYRQYFVQAGALDKAANKPVFDDKLMGRLVETWFLQETGKLLGLKTNAGASSTPSVADIRNGEWLKMNAFNGSATDQVLVNYVAQPEDKLEPHLLLARISGLDKWMINWGYRVVPGNEGAVLEQWIRQYDAEYGELFIGEPGAAPSSDPRNQVNNLANDPVAASMMGISNLRSVVPHLLDWTSEPATGNERAAQLYSDILERYALYAKHVVRQLGGIRTNIRTSAQKGPVFSYVSKREQEDALRFLHGQVFETPTWLRNEKLYERTAQCFDSVTNVQRAILAEVMDRNVLLRLQTVAMQDSAAALHPLDFLNNLRDGIFYELKHNAPVPLPRRELQMEYIARLLALGSAFSKSDNDLPAAIGYHSRQLLKMLADKRTELKRVDALYVSAMYERLCIGMYGVAAKKN